MYIRLHFLNEQSFKLKSRSLIEVSKVQGYPTKWRCKVAIVDDALVRNQGEQ